MKRPIHSLVSAALALGALVLIACGPAPLLPSAATPTVRAPAASAATALPIVPPGFRVTRAYDRLQIATAVLRDGDYFYVTELLTGNLLRLTDTNGDGALDESVVFATGFEAPRAMAIHPKTGEMYLSSRGQINVLRDTNGDGAADENRVVIQGLVDLDFMHTNNGIAFGPDGRLYINDGAPRLKRIRKKGEGEMTPFAGTVLSANPDGSDLKVYANGFRNPFGMAFAADGSLYVTDNGEDSIQKPYQGDELNLIVAGGDYGYPDVFGEPPAGSDTVAPIINFPADSAPTGVIVYEAQQFPEMYRGNVFVALWNIGHKIVRAWRDDAGKWQAQDFMTGLKFPVGMTLGADGSLYVLDMADGVDGGVNAFSKLYRVEYAP